MSQGRGRARFMTGGEACSVGLYAASSRRAARLAFCRMTLLPSLPNADRLAESQKTVFFCGPCASSPFDCNSATYLRRPRGSNVPEPRGSGTLGSQLRLVHYRLTSIASQIHLSAAGRS
jgi:hypothetical protein